jgi:hypothetical protein
MLIFQCSVPFYFGIVAPQTCQEGHYPTRLKNGYRTMIGIHTVGNLERRTESTCGWGKGAKQEYLGRGISSATYDSTSVPIEMTDHMEGRSCCLNNVSRA